MGFRGHADGTNNPQLFNLPGKNDTVRQYETLAPVRYPQKKNHPYNSQNE